jgi:hypothetical protein
MLNVVIVLLFVVAVVEAVPLLRRDSRLDEVARFKMVRRITSAWARHHPREGSTVEG